MNRAGRVYDRTENIRFVGSDPRKRLEGTRA